MTFKGFLKTLSYILGIFITVLILSGISYLIIDGINKKSNVMDIGEYSPVSTLVVPENPTYKSKIKGNVLKMKRNYFYWSYEFVI